MSNSNTTHCSHLNSNNKSMSDSTSMVVESPRNTTFSHIQNTQPSVTKMYYRLTPIHSRQALEDIKRHTNNFDQKYNISADFIENLTQSLDTDSTIFHGFLYAPTSADACKIVIGKNGCYFHQTTTKQNISMIWHDRMSSPPVFRFWGFNRSNLIRAMNIIRHRILTKS